MPTQRAMPQKSGKSAVLNASGIVTSAATVPKTMARKILPKAASTPPAAKKRPHALKAVGRMRWNVLGWSTPAAAGRLFVTQWNVKFRENSVQRNESTPMTIARGAIAFARGPIELAPWDRENGSAAREERKRPRSTPGGCLPSIRRRPRILLLPATTPTTESAPPSGTGATLCRPWSGLQVLRFSRFEDSPATSVREQPEQHAGQRRGRMAHRVARRRELGRHRADTHALEGLDRRRDRVLALGRVGRDRPLIQGPVVYDGHVHAPRDRLEDRGEVVGGVEPVRLPALGHDVAHVHAEPTGRAHRLRDGRDRQVRQHGGEEAARPEHDHVGA